MLRSYLDKMVRKPERDKRANQKNNHPQPKPKIVEAGKSKGRLDDAQ